MWPRCAAGISRTVRSEGVLAVEERRMDVDGTYCWCIDSLKSGLEERMVGVRWKGTALGAEGCEAWHRKAHSRLAALACSLGAQG